MSLAQVNIAEIAEGKARKYVLRELDIVGEGGCKALLLNVKTELTYLTLPESMKYLTEQLMAIELGKWFYLGKKDGAFVVKPAKEENESKLPWQTEPAKPEKMVFGKTEKNGFTPPEKPKPSEILENVLETGNDATRSAKAAVTAEEMGKLLDADVEEELWLTCPHCREIVKVAINIKRSKIKRSDIIDTI